MEKQSTDMEKIISLAKRRGFIFQGSEVYGGLAGTWDYGPLGISLKNNIKQSWWNTFVESRQDMYGLDASILMNHKVWEASGHVAGFSDPLVEDTKTGKRYRADHLLEDAGVDVAGLDISGLQKAITENKVTSPDGNPLGEVREFNMMFKTTVGPVADDESVSYLRPETAQGIFVNFKNVLDTMRPRLPFGIGQIGKAFRNEIAPRDFIFRSREFEQMEVEYFVREEEWEKHFQSWKETMISWMGQIGLDMKKVHELDVPESDRAHYSKKTIDFEFNFPFGKKELYGLAYRTDYDLKKHAEHSGQSMEYIDPDDNKNKFIPHVIEPSLGVDRTVLAVLASAYTEDEVGGEARTFLKFAPEVAPVKVAVFPLLKNKPDLVSKAREVYEMIRKEIPQVMFDDNGNVGKRYRRQDEIGTPFCVTIDFETLEDDTKDTVTIRDRDTGQQERVAISELLEKIGV